MAGPRTLEKTDSKDHSPRGTAAATKITFAGRAGLFLFIVLAGACILYYAVLAPDRFGAYHDDSIYVTTAKALATGQGYRIISLPYEPAQTKYPVFYPFLLSLIWRASPQFPQNLIPMMVFSVLATLVFLLLTWRYLVTREYATPSMALVVVGLSSINWRMMILATAIYSEMVYAALSVVGLYLAEKYEQEKKKHAAGLILGIVLGLVFLTRSSGVALLIAVAAYYVTRRRFKEALLPIGVGVVFVAGWVGWCYVNRTTVDGVNVAYYTSYLGHLNQVIGDLQIQTNASKLSVLFGILIENLIGGFVISIPLICSGINYSWIPNLGGNLVIIGICFVFSVLLLFVVGFLKDASKGLRLLHIYVIASLGLYLFWLPDVSYDRFAMPLLPFLLLFVLRQLGGLASIARIGLALQRELAQKLSAAFIGLLVIGIAAAGLVSYASGIYYSVTSLKTSASRAAEDNDAIRWIDSNTSPTDVLLCYRDPKYFLYTHHKATRSFPMRASVSWQEDESGLRNLADNILNLADEAGGARYLVLTSTDFELEDQPDQRRNMLRKMIDRYQQNFTSVFESADARTRIYRIENDLSR